MKFFPTAQKRVVGFDGSPNARIALIGEALGAQEEKLGKPFMGHSGGVLDSCLRSAGLIRPDLYITNLVKTKPVGNNIAPYYREPSPGRPGALTDLGKQCAAELLEELAETKANVFVTLGRPALLALTHTDQVSKYRGYVMTSPHQPILGRKVIPTFHPAATLRGNYIWRYYIAADLKKAAIEAETPELRRPEREIVWPDTYDNAMEWLDYFASCASLSIDIEVINYEVSCIGFSDSPERGFSLPMYHSPEPKWTVEEEARIWRRVAQILGDENIIKVFQNGIFDVHFLMVRCGIHTRPLTPEMYHDTMLGHSVMFPEFLKGLGFLGSLYCGAQEYWKDGVKFKNIKSDS